LFPYVQCASCKTYSIYSVPACPEFSVCSWWSCSSCFCTQNKQGLPIASSFCSYCWISVTTPAPTVLPPSLMAKRSSFSRAMGVTSSTVRVTLSPGMTISTPSGSFVTPVTSVVRK